MNTAESKVENAETHENQGGIEIFVVLLHVLCVILHSLSFIHRVEIELGVVVFDRLEVDPEGLLNAMGRSQYSGHLNQTWNTTAHHRGPTLTGLELSSPLIATSSEEESGSERVARCAEKVIA